jgi:prenyltransferase beta subunit
LTFDTEIEKGLSYLFSVRNPDNGWPALKPGDVSGLWTTGEIVNLILGVGGEVGFEMVEPSVHFILRTQLEDGSWPLIQVPPGSVFSTSECLISLSSIRRLHVVTPRDDELGNSIRRGLEWLTKAQNQDGGWGIENVTGESSRSRTMPTCCAMRALSSIGQVDEALRALDWATDYLLRIRNPNGSWGHKGGATGDVSNTARAIIALSAARKYDKDSKVMKKGLGYILSSHKPGYLWANTEERMTRSEGLLVIDSFTTYDILRVLTILGYYGAETLHCLKWLLSTQLANGGWLLQCPVRGLTKEASTWVTAEAVSVLASVGKTIRENPRPLLEVAFSLSESQRVSPPLPTGATTQYVDPSETIVIYEPSKIFISRRLGDIIATLSSIGLLGLLSYFLSVSLETTMSLSAARLPGFILLSAVALLWLLYGRCGRIGELRSMDRWKFWGLIGGVLVAIATVVQITQ